MPPEPNRQRLKLKKGSVRISVFLWELGNYRIYIVDIRSEVSESERRRQLPKMKFHVTNTIVLKTQ